MINKTNAFYLLIYSIPFIHYIFRIYFIVNFLPPPSSKKKVEIFRIWNIYINSLLYFYTGKFESNQW